MNKLDQKLNNLFSRRSFLAGAGGVAAAGMVAGCSDNGKVTTPSPGTSTPTDYDVLNFALNLEYLEAQFYLYAATGSGLQSSDTTAGSASTYTTVGSVTTSGNIAVQAVPGLNSEQQDIINEIAFEEQQHVRFLRTALGTSAVPMPDIDLTFFGPLAVAATIDNSNTLFSPFTSFDSFLIGAFIFEDVGVTAYSGAAPLISTAGVAAGYLNAAAGILAVEAYHAAYVRTALTANAIAAGSVTAYPYISIANLVADLRATLTVGNTVQPSMPGSVETLLTLPNSTTTPSSIVPADPTTAVGFARTVNQVLHIVYGSATVGVKSGGFFPSGMNSIFATTTA